VFGTVAAGQYGQAVQAGLPDASGEYRMRAYGDAGGANYTSTYGMYQVENAPSDTGTVGTTYQAKGVSSYNLQRITARLSRDNPIYGNSDTVTPSHVKYPWVIVAYNAAVPPSVAQAGEFMGLLDGKADKSQLDIVVAPGFVMPFAANSNPAGYLLCNGAAVSRTTYAKLFEAIGTTYGTGDGSTSFNLPDLTNKFIQGSGTAGTVHAAGLPNITGNVVEMKGYTATKGSGALYKSATKSGGGYYDEAVDRSLTLSFDASRSNAIYGKSTTVQPPALTMRYYIKY
jgi:hypothetical protein